MTKWSSPIVRNLRTLFLIGKMLGQIFYLLDHKFELCLLYLKCFSITIENRSVTASIYKEFVLANKQVDATANDNWVEHKPKRRQGPIFEKTYARKPKGICCRYT